MYLTKKQNKLIFIILLLIFFISPVSAQDTNNLLPGTKPNIKQDYIAISVVDSLYLTDTLAIRRNLIVKFIDSVTTRHEIRLYCDTIKSNLVDSVVILSDTILVNEDTVFRSGEIILQQIHQFSRKKNFFSRILRGVFRYEPVKGVKQQFIPVKGEIPYARYEDKVIRSINVLILDVLGYDIKDTLRKPETIIEKGANAVHIKSHSWLIRNKVLFKIGEKVKPFQISETERILRESNYLYDARIYIVETPGKDSVDIKVVVQDVFSISGGVTGDVVKKKGELKFQDVNFLGLGQTFNYRLFVSPDIPYKSNHYILYNINNISNTFLVPYIYLNHEVGKRNLGFGLNRELVTPELSWIGGVNYQRYKFPFTNNLKIPAQFKGDTLTFDRYDIWGGIPVYMSKYGKEKLNGRRLIFGCRFLYTKFEKRPSITLKDSYLYYNHQYILFNISVFKRQSFRDHYIFRFGRTEDIPVGYLFSVTTGIDNSERAIRFYSGISLYKSFYNIKYGYFFYNISAGTYYNPGYGNEESIAQFRMMYFTPLKKILKSRSRTFIGLRSSVGDRMILGNSLNLNNDAGIRGFNAGNLTGNKKLILNFEEDLILPYSFIGFKFAMVAFADFGFISYKYLLDKNNLFNGFGLGIKIKNDHLNLQSIQLMFGYYPATKNYDYHNYLLFQRSSSFFNFNDFSFSRPEVLSLY